MALLAQTTPKSDSSFATEKGKKGPGEGSETQPGLDSKKNDAWSPLAKIGLKSQVQILLRGKFLIFCLEKI